MVMAMVTLMGQHRSNYGDQLETSVGRHQTTSAFLYTQTKIGTGENEASLDQQEQKSILCSMKNILKSEPPEKCVSFSWRKFNSV